MPFTFSPTPLEGVIRIESKLFADKRGYFLESFKESNFTEAGVVAHFLQDNHSFSRAGVIRGLHYQKSPKEQGKLVSVISGEIFDVALDIRLQSKTFGKWYGLILSESDKNMLWIPPGFAHGFQALKDSHVYYKATREFSKENDSGIRWNDPDIGIEWPCDDYTVSEKDMNLPFLKEIYPKGGNLH